MAARRPKRPPDGPIGESPPPPGVDPDAPRRVGDLEIVQDEPWQRRMGLVQVASWVALYLMLALGVLGLFGGGPLSDAAAGAGGPLAVRFERFERSGRPTELRLTLAAGAVTGPEARVWIDADTLRRAALKRVEPAPRAVVAGADRHVFVFRLDAPGAPAEFVLEVEPRGPGVRRSRVGLDGTPGVPFGRYVFP
jgi:hypothetical protein